MENKKRVAFYTLGCKVNQYETNGMIQKFMDNNYNIVDFSEEADIYIINTCTVTNMSDRKSRQVLRRAKDLNSDAIVVAVGCYAQVAKDELEKYDEIDLVLGNNEKIDIIKNIEEFAQENKSNVTDVMYKKDFSEFGSITYTEKTRAVIKVQDGCDRFCSYCIIPYARGKVRSRMPENVIEEVKEIVKNGIKEIVLTGIHIASYGKDFNNGYKLIDLLEDLNKIENLERIRLGSLEPTLITREFMERLIKLEKVCHHFHLSLQSGCTETLKRMNRKYEAEEFADIVKLLREYYKDCILTTDIIVGFPGETDEEFETTYKFLQDIKFYKMHIFKYSPRKGTKAEKFPNQIPGNIKEERSNRLLELSDKNENEYLCELIGKNVLVLFEEFDGEYYKGHTANYVMVKAKGKDLENKIQEVKVQQADKESVIGILTE